MERQHIVEAGGKLVLAADCRSLPQELCSLASSLMSLNHPASTLKDSYEDYI